MTNFLGQHFQARRLDLGLSLVEVAARLGRKNVAKACNRVLKLERDGVAVTGFLPQLAAVLDINDAKLSELASADLLAYRRAWAEWVEGPAPLSIGMRAVPGFVVGVPLPAGVTTPEAAVAFAQAHAARLHKKVFVTLIRRECVGITETGAINGRFFASAEEGNGPGMYPRRFRFLCRLAGGEGA